MVCGTIRSKTVFDSFVYAQIGLFYLPYFVRIYLMKSLLSFGFLAGVIIVLAPFSALASVSDGTIDSTYKYAWSENTGWINFGCDNCDARVTDSGLSGYALSETVGWINLDAVVNDGEGNLSGYAWGENVGYIKFDPVNGGVSINSSGEFTGSALGENIGWIIFDGDYKVKTDWRPVSAMAASEEPAVAPSSGGSSGSASGRRNATMAASYISNVGSALSGLAEKAADLAGILSFWKSEDKLLPAIPSDIAAKEPSESMAGDWSLLPGNSINKFVFASLPYEIQNLVKKFPELGKTFNEVGITKVTDLQKLKNAKFILPGLNSKVGLSGGVRVPISSLTQSQKALVPAEVIFAKAGDLIDYNVQLAINEDGIPEQRITTIAGKPLDLAIKEDKPVNGIKGYVVVKNIERQQAKKSVPADSMLASPLFAVLGINHEAGQEVEIKEEFVVSRFDYEDGDKDGIYTANITSPLVSGEYEIISIIDYKDSSLGKKELRLVTVVDPEGYVYEKNGNKETRVPDAKVSLYWKNPKGGDFEIWPAKDYSQVNPQKTDKSGSYSFLVPEGFYKLSVSSEEYYAFESDEFEVEEGRGVHMNIEMKPKSWWSSLLNLFNYLFK